MDPRRKGYRGEKEWERFLREKGYPSYRIPLSGAVFPWKGDVDSDIKGVKVLWDVKRRRKMPKWIRKEALAVREDGGEWYIVMKAELFFSLLGA